jgi:hypothetical protein
VTADCDRTGEKVVVSVDFTDEAVATALRAGSAVPEQLSLPRTCRRYGFGQSASRRARLT